MGSCCNQTVVLQDHINQQIAGGMRKASERPDEVSKAMRSLRNVQAHHAGR